MHERTVNMRRIRVTAPARLHLGFLDLDEGLGRNFGSLGLTLDGLATVVSAAPGPILQVDGSEMERVEKFASQLLERFGHGQGARVWVEQAIPAHIGLGSGTQLSLAVGSALSRLFDWDLSPRAIASLAERGARSGIGIGAFEHGGFLFDSGKTASVEPPGIIARAEFPAAWRVLLIFDQRIQGLHGTAEIKAFQALPEFPLHAAGELCRLAFMQALPGLLEADLPRFSNAIGRIQQIVGDHFASAQGGRFVSPIVTEVLNWLESQGIGGIGQSSWGPTGFAMLASETQARHVLEVARARWGKDDAVGFLVCNGLNRGATMEFLNHDTQRTAQFG
jgi:beta-RFAP synthase